MKLYVVRHCKADGQEREAELTPEGKKQAVELASFLKSHSIVDLIVSSPFKRAIDSIQPFAKMSGIQIHTDERLTERILSNEDDPNWKENLRRTYDDEHLKFAGGESSFEAKRRVVSLLYELESSEYSSVLFVSHGNLISLLINHFDHSFGFRRWEQLSNPDVYMIDLKLNDITRLWVD